MPDELPCVCPYAADIRPRIMHESVLLKIPIRTTKIPGHRAGEMKYCWRNMKCLSDMKWLRHEVKFALMCEAHFIVSTTSYTAGVLHLPQANFIEKRTCFCKCVFLVPLTGLEPVRSCPQRILSPRCLPFHHSGVYLIILA